MRWLTFLFNLVCSEIMSFSGFLLLINWSLYKKNNSDKSSIIHMLTGWVNLYLCHLHYRLASHSHNYSPLNVASLLDYSLDSLPYRLWLLLWKDRQSKTCKNSNLRALEDFQSFPSKIVSIGEISQLFWSAFILYGEYQ